MASPMGSKISKISAMVNPMASKVIPILSPIVSKVIPIVSPMGSKISKISKFSKVTKVYSDPRATAALPVYRVCHWVEDEQLFDQVKG